MALFNLSRESFIWLIKVPDNITIFSRNGYFLGPFIVSGGHYCVHVVWKISLKKGPVILKIWAKFSIMYGLCLRTSVYLYGCIQLQWGFWTNPFSRYVIKNAHLGLMLGVVIKADGSMRVSRERVSSVQIIFLRATIRHCLQNWNFKNLKGDLKNAQFNINFNESKFKIWRSYH